MSNICITGPGSSGKTTLAISIAQTITKIDKSASCIIVFCKNMPSQYPVIFPFVQNTEFKPLSSLINQDISTDNLSKYILTKRTSPNLGFIGYTEFDTKYTYPDMPNSICNKFIKTLENMCSYLIFDCDDNIFSSPLSLECIKQANVHIKVLNPNIKSITYENMTRDYIDDKSNSKRKIQILNNLRENKYNDKSDFQYAYDIPYREKILLNYHKGNLIEYNYSNETKTQNIIFTLTKDILHGEK